jgi:uncharacterized protein with PQ loop repeat
MKVFKLLPFGLFLLGLMTLLGCENFEIQETPSGLFSVRFPLKEVVGFLAGFGTTFAGLPDLIALFKRKSSKGMRPRMAAIMGIFQVAWIYYGLMIASRPVILWNTVAVLVNFLTVGAYLHYARREKTS